MLIRRATRQDAEKIRQYTLAACVSRDSSEEGFVEFPVPSEEDYQRRLTLNPFSYIAENGEKTAGFLTAFPDYFYISIVQDKDPLHEIVHSTPIEPTVYLEQIFTRPAYRKKGIAKEMYRQLFQDAGKAGYEKLIGAIWEKNNPSIKLHEGLEFQVKKSIKKDGLTFLVVEKEITSQTKQ